MAEHVNGLLYCHAVICESALLTAFMSHGVLVVAGKGAQVST